ncbi:MAG: hypothetical protein P9M14_04610 [Candidatus Alcyoniella australis]|nr:hypothetical protein [Candidatus Alcyoniella australis]
MKKVALMFSGGVDSTALAIGLAEEYERIHLLTYDNGYGTTRMNRSAARAQELNSLVAPKYEHALISIRPLFQRVLLDTLDRDYEQYESGFIWCMGCKLAMHGRTIALCLKHGIEHACDGSSGDTPEMVEQMPLSLELVRGLYREYGIEFSNPAYDARRADSDALLSSMGFKLGLPLMGRRLSSQPACRPGELYYLPFLLLGQPPQHAEQTVRRFIEDKSQIVRQLIAELTEDQADATR